MDEYYKKAENKCRNLFTQFVKKMSTGSIWDIKYEQANMYSRTDGYYMSAFTEVITELKVRDYNHTNTWNGRPEGWVFEKIKYDALMASEVKDKTFIIIFRDKVCIWNIDQMKDIKWQDELLSSNSVNNPGKSSKRIKTVTYLKIEQASHIFDI